MHAAGLTNEVQNGCGNVVDRGVVALAGVDEVASQLGGLLTVLEGDTRPDGGIPGKDVRIIVEVAREVTLKVAREVICKFICRLDGRLAGRFLYSIISEGALRPRRDLLIQLIIRVLSIPILLVLSH